MLALVTAGLVAGCSGPLTEPEARPSLFVEEAEVSAAARAAYGPAAGEAYEELAAFVLDESLVLDLLDPAGDQVGAEDLNEGIVGRLAPGSRPVWEARVAAALAGDVEAQGDVKVLRLYDLQVPEGVGLAPGDPVRSQVVTGAFVDVGEEPGEMVATTAPAGDGASTTAPPTLPLTVSLRHEAVLELRGRGGTSDVEVERDLSFDVVPGPPETDGPSWLIQSYEGDVRLTHGSEELPLTDQDATTSTVSGTG